MGYARSQPPAMVSACFSRRFLERPSIANALLKLNLPSFDPGRVVFFGDLYVGVGEQHRIPDR